VRQLLLGELLVTPRPPLLPKVFPIGRVGGLLYSVMLSVAILAQATCDDSVPKSAFFSFLLSFAKRVFFE
jgi:hypothetical protein